MNGGIGRGLAIFEIGIVPGKTGQGLDQDRLAGLTAGADYYLAKSGFGDQALLTAVADLIGEP